MKFVEIAHVAFRAKDPEKFHQFYTEVLELTKAFDLTTPEGEPWISYYQLPSGQFIELFPNKKLRGFGSAPDSYNGDNRQINRSHYHCCFAIDARHEAHRDMEKKGIPVRRTENDSVGMCGSWCSFVTDPEGNDWEMMEFSPLSRQLGDQKDNMNYNG